MVANTIVQGAVKICKRVEDISIPLFRAPYSGTSNQDFINGSLWPLTKPSSTVYETYGPVSKGKLTFNTLGFNAVPSACLYGSELFISAQLGGKILFDKVSILPGLTLTVDHHWIVGFDSCAADVASTFGIGACGNLGAVTTNTILASNRIIPALGFIPVFSRYVAFGANQYGYAFNPVNANYTAVSGRPWDFLYAYNATGSNFGNEILFSIPNFLTGINSVAVFNLTGNTQSKLNIGQMTVSGNLTLNSNIEVSELKFDDATVATEMNGRASSFFKTTAYGYLAAANGNALTPSQAYDYVLISPDGEYYALLKLLPQTGAVVADIKNINANKVHIDPNGIFYMQTQSFNVNNSFALNIPWGSVPLKLNIPPFEIPGICGCQPLGAMQNG